MIQADMCSDPLDIFAHLNHNRVGIKNAMLYIRWAMCLEDRGDYASAEKVLEKGIQRNAQPIEKLKSVQTQFTYRMVERIKRQQLKKESEPVVQRPTVLNDENSGTTRRALQSISKSDAATGLRTYKKKPVLIKSAQRNHIKPSGKNFVVFDDSQVKKPKKSKRIIFEDEEEHIPQDWSFLPSEKDRYKENTGVAEKWTKHKIPLRKTVTKPKRDFDLFVDEECQTETQNTNDISIRKKLEAPLKQSASADLHEQLVKNPLKFQKNKF